MPPDALLVLAVGGLRTPKRARQVACGRERSLAGVDAPGKPGRDLLQQPAIAVGVAERGEGAVGGDSRWLAIRSQLELDRPASAWNIVADLDAAGDELVARSLDVRDDQVQPLAEPGAADVMFVPNWTEHPSRAA